MVFKTIPINSSFKFREVFMTDKRKTIAVDFDGTLCQFQHFGDGRIVNPPNQDAVEIMNDLHETGYEIVIFTVRLHPKWGAEENREQRAELERWLKEYGVPYDEITNRKPEAVAYVDDRAIRFINWRDIGNYFLT